MRILAVDDDRLNIAMINEILGEDYHLITASSGEEGLEAASRFRPDLILLDVMMPGIDGFETCRQIRSNPDLKDVKVILVSAKSLTKERLKGYEVGADDYVTKPFNTDELLAKVRVFLRLRSVEELDRMQQQLLSLVAHEIRTPLTGIVPAGELLSGEASMEESERRMWGEMVLRNSYRLLGLAEKGLLLCQLTAGQVRLDLETLDLVDLAQTVVRESDAAAQEKNVEVVVGARDPLMVDGEERYLKMVLESVLDNAVKFSPVEGEVRVDLGGNEQSATFSITNLGPEVNPEEVFSAFSPRRVDDQIVGSGMSMALSRAIMRAHEGDMQIDSKPSAGTICTGWLPLHGAASPASDWD